jgi:uncharacterized membrane protein
MGAQLVYPSVPERRRPMATRGIVAMMLTTSAAETLQARGAARTLALLGSAGGIGLLAELLGTATGRPFGRYRYSRLLGPRIRGVPLAAGAAWAMMARPAWTVGGLLSSHRAGRVAAGAAALCAWDVFLDPRMVREGYWTWPGGGRYEHVPVSNFAGWLLTGSTVFIVWSTLEREPVTAQDDVALALYVWTWAGETLANAVVWRRPRVALAGGLAMGAFAVPALLTRSKLAP